MASPNRMKAVANKYKDELDFKNLMDTYQKQLYILIRRMVVDHDDTNDVLQEVFILVWKNLDKFKGESGIYTWMYRIAVNQCLKFIEKKKKRAKWMFSDYNIVLLDKIKADSGFNEDKTLLLLQEAILKLPEKQRLVFQMRYYDEMLYKEMSEILQTSEGALKASYHHAHKKIEEYVLINAQINS